jgi:predicted aminopeptidase
MGFLKKFRIVFSDILLLFVLFYSLFNARLTVYGIAQGKGQLKIILDAKKIDELLGEKKFSGTQKEKLELIAAVKKYSVDSLNYKRSKNYSDYYDQHGKPLLWIVTACEAYSMKAYEWKFPWLGEVSYKGFFDSTKAIKEHNFLRLKGYDADISRVSAWSTLGWFNDPVFSEMLKKSKGDIAELIFHELFHGTIYARNSVDLNENLANFISRKATMEFLRKDTAALNEYKADLKAEFEFNDFIFGCIAKLNEAYSRMEKLNYSVQQKQHEKMQLIFSFMRELKNRNFLSAKKTKRMQDRFLYSQNAYFMHFQRYDAMNDSLENIFKNKYNSNLASMVAGLKKEIPSL